MNKTISRRRLLVLAAMAAGGAGLAWARRFLGAPSLTAQGGTALEPRAYLPNVAKVAPTATPTATSTRTPTATPTRTPTPTATSTGQPPPGNLSGRVIHIHANSVTSWVPGGDSAYWNYVSQSKVNEMVDRGMRELTGRSTAADAWQALLPNYQAGQKVAIKVSFNNQWSGSCNDTNPAIDSVIEPVNAVVNRLIGIGVAAGDIWIYDAMRPIPDRFANRGVAGVQYYDKIGGCRNPAAWSNATITFSPPSGAPMPDTQYLPELLVNATYLINMPIMKHHACAGVSLAFKNHFGTIDNPAGMHNNVFLLGLGCGSSGGYRSDYSPLIDLYRSPHIGPKTILTIGDGLFAALSQENLPPSTWTVFNNQVPKSLFFATDAVAIDSVMCDWLWLEAGSLRQEAYNYLLLAHNAGLGVYEHGNPTNPNGSGYTSIYFRRFEV